MKIGFDAKRAFSNTTGLGNYSRFVINVLSNNFPKNEYLLYTPKMGAPEISRKILAGQGVQLRTPSSPITNLKLGSLWRSALLGNIALKDGVSLLHGLSNELPLISNKKLKTVVTIHDLLFLRYPELYGRIDIEIYIRKFRHACKTADRIIAISHQTADDIKHYFKTDERKIQVVYQGCDAAFKKEYFPSALKKVRNKYGLPEDFILSVGTIEHRKNALLILKAMAALKSKLDLPLVLVGRPTLYKTLLLDFAARENLMHRLIFLHEVAFIDLPKIFQMARLFVYPSVFEGFGIPIIEALNSKVPVISSKGSCFIEAGGPDSRYVAAGNAEELADTILNILHHKNVAANMVEKGLEYVKRFEDGHIAAELMAVYQEVLQT